MGSDPARVDGEVVASGPCPLADLVAAALSVLGDARDRLAASRELLREMDGQARTPPRAGRLGGSDLIFA